MRQILILFFAVLLISSCQRSQSEVAAFGEIAIQDEVIPTREEAVNPPAPPALPLSSEPIPTSEVHEKKVIKDGQLQLQVTDLQETRLRMDALAKTYNAYYANESYNNSDVETSFNLTIRIPCANFEKFIADIESGKGEVLFKHILARDVTDQFIDLETRLETKRNYLEKYRELLKQAKNVKELLEIEEQIRGLEEEIESTTGRLKYLSNQVDYSTLELMISKPKDFKFNPENRHKFSERIKQSLSKGWFGFVDFVLFLIRIWPLGLIATVVGFIWKRFKKRKNKKS